MSRSLSDSERKYIQVCVKIVEVYAVEPGYNDTGLYDTSSIASNILQYQLIPHLTGCQSPHQVEENYKIPKQQT